MRNESPSRLAVEHDEPDELHAVVRSPVVSRRPQVTYLEPGLATAASAECHGRQGADVVVVDYYCELLCPEHPVVFGVGPLLRAFALREAAERIGRLGQLDWLSLA
jgi:hypothetical protein